MWKTQKEGLGGERSGTCSCAVHETYCGGGGSPQRAGRAREQSERRRAPNHVTNRLGSMYKNGAPASPSFLSFSDSHSTSSTTQFHTVPSRLTHSYSNNMNPCGNNVCTCGSSCGKSFCSRRTQCSTYASRSKQCSSRSFLISTHPSKSILETARLRFRMPVRQGRC